MEEFVADQWRLFDIDEACYELFLKYVTSTAKALTADPDDQADIRGKMWLKCLVIRSTPPKDYPEIPERQVFYCKRAMRNAALACLYGDLPDGPRIRGGKYRVDPQRVTVSLSDLE